MEKANGNLGTDVTLALCAAGAMYIGPWQEYKLARLIHHQHQALARDVSREARRGGGLLDASPASSRSGFSGLSTQSAPAHVPGPSAQVRLNDYCDSIERCERRRWAARPRVPSGSSTASTRPYSSSSGSTRGQGESTSSASSGKAAAKRAAGPKKPGKPPKAVSLEEQRRTRIRHMQRLYGLGSDESSTLTPSIAGSENFVEDVPKQNSPERSKEGDGQLLPTVKESDPLTPPHKEERDPLMLSMSSSAGLIAWSKNLQPDELSPQASLASFFPAS